MGEEPAREQATSRRQVPVLGYAAMGGATGVLYLVSLAIGIADDLFPDYLWFAAVFPAVLVAPDLHTARRLEKLSEEGGQ